MQQTKFNFKWRRVVQKYKQISSSEVLQRGCSDINISTIYQKKQQLVMFERKILIEKFFCILRNFDFPGNSWGSCCCVWWGFLLRMLHPTRNNVFINIICKRKRGVNGSVLLVEDTRIFCKMQSSTCLTF